MPSTTTSTVFFCVYVLKSLKDGKKYIGFTKNIEKRIEEHHSRRSFATRSRWPFDLIYFEACLSEEDARRREQYLKTTGGRRFLAKRLRGYLFSLLKL